VPPESLVTARAVEERNVWITRLHTSEGQLKEPARKLQDTVGAVAWDTKGDLAAGVSRYFPLLG
jgi:isoaspartyl peptidase/L-asparaginase-like protein (Ntn-hydrolase superfamily)